MTSSKGAFKDASKEMLCVATKLNDFLSTLIIKRLPYSIVHWQSIRTTET